MRHLPWMQWYNFKKQKENIYETQVVFGYIRSNNDVKHLRAVKK
jgi:hypothetical protein